MEVEERVPTGAPSLPWVEKYRPSELGDLVSHTEIIATLQKLMSGGQLPNLLFYGPPGTGKTSTVLACAKQLYGSSTQSTCGHTEYSGCEEDRKEQCSLPELLHAIDWFQIRSASDY